MSKLAIAFAAVLVLALAGCGGQVDEAASGTVSGKIEESQLDPGKTASATFDLPSGSYVLVCNVPGHYKEGMFSSFQVTAGQVAAGGTTSAPVAIELGEWFIRPAPASVSAGSVTFEVRNRGGSTHNLVVIRTDLAADALVVQ